jgi:hypothetical protein
MHYKRNPAMKLVLVREEDRSICEEPLMPEHYQYFHDNKKEILTMINEQVSFVTLYILIS